METKIVTKNTWREEFDKRWRILRPLYELPVDQKLAFDQHDRKLEEIKVFIDSLLSSFTEKVLGEVQGLKTTEWQTSLEEGSKDFVLKDEVVEVITRLNKE